jgi:fimbrial chaperone protein
MNKIVINLKNIFENTENKYFYQIKKLSYFLILMSLPYLSWAGSFYIVPTKGELSEDSNYIVFEVKNTSENTSAIQIQAMSWEIQNGEDVVKPTKDIIATPVIVNIKPNTKQIIRVGLNRNPDKEEELFYKLLIKEIPRLKKTEINETQITVEFSIPIILKANENTKTNLNIKTAILPNETLSLEIENQGKKHEILKSVVIKNNDIEIKEIFKQPIYLRPKEKNLTNLKINNLKNIENKLKIILETDNGNIESDANVFKK